MPLAKSLKDTIARVIPYFEKQIRPQLMEEKRVLNIAHENSLRALVMYLEHLSQQEIIGLNLATGIPLVYRLDDKLSVINK